MNRQLKNDIDIYLATCSYLAVDILSIGTNPIYQIRTPRLLLKFVLSK